MSIELLFLLILLPTIQDQSHTREWIKYVVKAWCKLASWLLDLKSYLLGDREEDEETNEEAENNDENEIEEDEGNVFGLGAVHQVLLHSESPTGTGSYEKPNYFVLRVS